VRLAQAASADQASDGNRRPSDICVAIFVIISGSQANVVRQNCWLFEIHILKTPNAQDTEYVPLSFEFAIPLLALLGLVTRFSRFSTTAGNDFRLPYTKLSASCEINGSELKKR
jgi:hypothetical protein